MQWVSAQKGLRSKPGTECHWRESGRAQSLPQRVKVEPSPCTHRSEEISWDAAQRWLSVGKLGLLELWRDTASGTSNLVASGLLLAGSREEPGPGTEWGRKQSSGDSSRAQSPAEMRNDPGRWRAHGGLPTSRPYNSCPELGGSKQSPHCLPVGRAVQGTGWKTGKRSTPKSQRNFPILEGNRIG